MFTKLNKTIRRTCGPIPLLMIVSIILMGFLNLTNAAKKSKSGIMTQKHIPKDSLINAEKIYSLSYKTPIRYHYTPWITRKLLLTMNITSTNTQYFSLEQVNAVTSESMEDDYKCDHPPIISKKDCKKIKQEIKPSLKSDDFKNVKNLTCNEKEFLNTLSKEANKTDHWPRCQQFNKNSIDEICEKAAETAKKLKEQDITDTAAHDELKSVLNNYSLRYCNKFGLKDVISKVNRERMLGQKEFTHDCKYIMIELLRLDALVNFFSCEFNEILSRIYCQGYSVKSTCEECSNAYKQWLCSMTLPYYIEDLVLKPCLSICQRVERTCPYLHPEMKDQYGGEPIFVCNDPDIPVDKNAIDQPYGKDRACLQRCHLEANHTLTMRIENPKTETIEPVIDNEEAQIENPDFEICIDSKHIVNRLQNLLNNTDNSTIGLYLDNEERGEFEILQNATRNEKSKRDLLDNLQVENDYTLSRMADEIEIEVEQIVEEANKETMKNSELHVNHQLDDIYYLDSNNSQMIEEHNLTQNSSKDDDQKFKFARQTVSNDKDSKFRINQHQDAFNHFSEDDENDNEDGDSDLDQVISTTTITSLNYAANKQTNHLDKKQ